MAEREKQEEAYRVEMGETKRPSYSPMKIVKPVSKTTAGPGIAIISYCVSSILMTLTNKYVLSGYDFNMNFMLLAIQVRPFPAELACLKKSRAHTDRTSSA